MRSPVSLIKYSLIAVGALATATAVVVGVGSYSFNQSFKGKVDRLFKNQRTADTRVITEDDIKDLPDPVKRYLQYAGVIGKKRVATVRLKQKGFMRPKPDGKWIPIEAEQYYTVDNPGFVWFGRFNPAAFMSAQDMYLEGKGNMHIKALSTITIVNGKGTAMDEASLMRFFNEMQWFPTSLVSDKVRWEPIDGNSARATMTDHGITVSAVFHFDDKGRLVNFVAQRGRDTGGGKLVTTQWSTPNTDPDKEYRTANGLRLPCRGEAVWHLDSGDYSYIRLEVTDVEYDNPSLYK